MSRASQSMWPRRAWLSAAAGIIAVLMALPPGARALPTLAPAPPPILQVINGPAEAGAARAHVELPAGVPAVQFGGPEPLEIATAAGVVGFDVELAVNPAQRARGLMYRRALPDGRGMLFDFGTERQVTMWMQNTYISLDMLFIAGDGRILRVAENTTPLSTEIVSSEGPARFVLELPAGTARRLGIAAGDRVGHRLVGRR